jgi:hypothetical protein
VIDVPVVPRSPLITVGPVFVTLALLRTPNVAAEPRLICERQRWDVSEQKGFILAQMRGTQRTRCKERKALLLL